MLSRMTPAVQKGYYFILLPAHPADGEEQTRPSRADTGEAVSQPPVKQVLRNEGEDREAHGCCQHIKDPCHIIHI